MVRYIGVLARFVVVGVIAVLVALGILGTFTAPKPPESGMTTNWVLDEHIPYLARGTQDHSKVGQGWELRSSWAFEVLEAFQAVSRGGTASECPSSLQGLETSRYLPFIPLDRYGSTPLRGDFLHERSFTPSKSDSFKKMDSSEIQQIVGSSDEGSVLFHKGAKDTSIAIAFFSQTNDGSNMALLRESCAPSRSVANPNAPELWKVLATSLSRSIKSYVAYTGRAPTSMKDLDGTVGRMNPKAWNDPDVGPILKQISDRLIPLVQQSVKPEPAMGEFEPIPAS